MAVRVVRWCLCLALLGGCSAGDKPRKHPVNGLPAGDAGAVDAAGDAPAESPLPPGPCDDVGAAYLSHAAPRPAGFELGVVLAPAAGSALSPEHDYAACLAEPSARRHTFDEAALMLLVRPTGPAQDTQMALEQLVLAREAREQVGVLLWSDLGVTVVDMPTRERTRTLDMLARALAAPPPASQPIAEVPSEASQILRSVGGEGEAWFRGLVVWAPDATADLTMPDPADGFGVSSFGLSVSEGTPSERALALGGAVNDAIARGYYGVTRCAGEDATLTLGEQSLAVELPKLAPELSGLACAESSPSSALPSVRTVDFSFAEGERAVFDQRVMDRDKADFALSVRWSESVPAVTARAHLRGQSSLDCARKSFAVDLEGGAVRPFAPSFTSDEFFLLSMCLDEGYVNQTTADELARELGLFPFSYEHVELTVEGVSQGLYLMLEEPSDGLSRRLGSMLQSLVRRRTDIDGKLPEVDYARDGEAQALADYDALVSALEGLSGEALHAEIVSRMDLTLFYRWVALMTVLGNGDYVDEVFFYATDGIDAQGKVAPFFSVLGWDPDDLFSPCHHQGRFAIDDPHGILYCAEGVLEHRLLGDAFLYERFVTVLESVIERITPARFDAALAQSAERALELLSDDAVRAASSEFIAAHPEATSAAGAKAAIDAIVAQMKQDFRNQRTLLLERIGKYRTP